MLDKIDDVHMGINKCREQAKQTVWWPGLSKQIQDIVENCQTCLKHKVNLPEPLCPTPFPERPWQEVGTDLFHFQSSIIQFMSIIIQEFIAMLLKCILLEQHIRNCQLNYRCTCKVQMMGRRAKLP